MKCEKCGFVGSILEWQMVERSGVTKLPENTIKQFEEFIDSKEDISEELRKLVKVIFRVLGEVGLMPYHETNFVCPKCGNSSHQES